MLAALILAVAITAQPAPEAPAGPSVSPPPIAAGTCPERCACPFPGACGHKGCACTPVTGWRPPDEWRPYEKNPEWEVFGRVDESGVFRYTKSRLRKAVTARYLCRGVEPDGDGAATVRIDLKRQGAGPPATATLRTYDPALKALFREGRVVTVTITPGE